MKSIANDIVSKAREYVGTRWLHQGRVKGVGVDCIGLVVCVARELGLCDYDTTNYSRIPDGKVLRAGLDANMVLVRKSAMQPGDVLLIRFEEEPQHVAIVSDMGGRLGIIHAYAQVRKVTEHGLDELWLARTVGVYRFKECTV